MWSMEKHIQCAEQIQAMYNEVDHCILEMHRKKARFARKKYHLNSKADERFYCKNLFYKKKGRSNFDVFPCAFKSALESAMFSRHKHDARCTIGVYYGGQRVPAQRIFLSERPTLTAEDIATIRGVNKNYVRFMDACIAEVKSTGQKKDAVKEMQKWRNHVHACTASPWDRLRRRFRLFWAVAHFWIKTAAERVGRPGVGHFALAAVAR